jgi:hypothetical protein
MNMVRKLRFYFYLTIFLTLTVSALATPPAEEIKKITILSDADLRKLKEEQMENGHILQRPPDYAYKRQISEHRARVGVMTMEIFSTIADQHPLQFKKYFSLLASLPIERAKLFVRTESSLHDILKLKNPYLDKLYDNWGVDFHGGRPQYIIDMNEEEDALKFNRAVELFPELDKELIRQLLKEVGRLEFWADVLDTKETRSQELNIQPEENAAENFFKERHDPVGVVAVHMLKLLHYTRLSGENSCAILLRHQNLIPQDPIMMEYVH